MAQCASDPSRVKPFQHQPMNVKSALVRRAIMALCVEKVQTVLAQFSSDGTDVRKQLMLLAHQLHISEIVILLNKLERFEGKRLDVEASRPIVDYNQHSSISKHCGAEDEFDGIQGSISCDRDGTTGLGIIKEIEGQNVIQNGKVGLHEQELRLDFALDDLSEPPLKRQKVENL